MSTDLAGVAVEFVVLFGELLVVLFMVSAVLALLVRRAYLGLQEWLGGSPAVAALKGMGLGFVVPSCIYSAIPVFVGMIDARVRTATWVAFLLAAPLLDPLVLAVLLLLFGWQATFAYAAVTAVVVLLLALVADATALQRWLWAARPRVGASGRQRLVARYAWRQMRRLAAPMAVAVAIAAVIVGFVPHQLVERLAGPDNPLAVPAATALGAPFCVSTEASLPIAAGLHNSGMELGAVFALVTYPAKSAHGTAADGRCDRGRPRVRISVALTPDFRSS